MDRKECKDDLNIKKHEFNTKKHDLNTIIKWWDSFDFALYERIIKAKM